MLAGPARIGASEGVEGGQNWRISGFHSSETPSVETMLAGPVLVSVLLAASLAFLTLHLHSRSPLTAD